MEQWNHLQFQVQHAQDSSGLGSGLACDPPNRLKNCDHNPCGFSTHPGRGESTKACPRKSVKVLNVGYTPNIPYLEVVAHLLTIFSNF